MLTGHAPFDGGTVCELLASVLKVEPDWPRLASVAPERGQHLVRRCLRKDQNLRIHAIADARIEIDDIQTEPDGGRDAGPDLNRAASGWRGCPRWRS